MLSSVRRDSVGFLAGTLFLFTPRIFLVIWSGWTEPFVVLMLVALVVQTARVSKPSPVLAGFFLGLKQYTPLAIPALVCLCRDRRDRYRLLSLLWGAAVLVTSFTILFLLWDPAAFLNGVLLHQFRLPFRTDALSFAAYIVRRGGPVLPAWVPLALAVAAMTFALRKLPRTPAACASVIAGTYLVFFVFNKQAFCNYYFLVIGALCCSIAVFKPGRAEESLPPVPQP
jgi:hypothetical protein